MMGRLEAKTAIVTGAGSGMGKAIAEAFAAQGAKVLCADISGHQEKVALEIGGDALPLQIDVSVPADVKMMILAAEETFGRVDILVNNAGIGCAPKPLHEQDEQVFDRVLAVNLRGVFLGMKYGIISMLKTGGGSIINIASSAGLVGAIGLSSYAASKGGVVQLTKTAALEYARRQIRVNAICPGVVWTPMMPGYDGSQLPSSDVPAPPWVPAGRWGLPSEIAATAVFLASEDAGYLTGAALPVDGGFTAG